MEKPEKINARQAKEIALNKKATLDECMREINVTANLGGTHVNIWKLTDPDLQKELMELGFAISFFTDPMGMKATRITW